MKNEPEIVEGSVEHIRQIRRSLISRHKTFDEFFDVLQTSQKDCRKQIAWGKKLLAERDRELRRQAAAEKKLRAKTPRIAKAPRRKAS